MLHPVGTSPVASLKFKLFSPGPCKPQVDNGAEFQMRLLSVANDENPAHLQVLRDAFEMETEALDGGAVLVRSSHKPGVCLKMLPGQSRTVIHIDEHGEESIVPLYEGAEILWASISARRELALNYFHWKEVVSASGLGFEALGARHSLEASIRDALQSWIKTGSLSSLEEVAARAGFAVLESSKHVVKIGLEGDEEACVSLRKSNQEDEDFARVYQGVRDLVKALL